MNCPYRFPAAHDHAKRFGLPGQACCPVTSPSHQLNAAANMLLIS
jgi:hypothetical protein